MLVEINREVLQEQEYCKTMYFQYFVSDLINLFSFLHER